MSNLNEEDIAVLLEEAEDRKALREVNILDFLMEWERLIFELSDKEVLLFKMKSEYERKSEEIVATTNFKELYGANNQKVRDNHVRNTLSEDYELIKDLEFSISYISRRMSFLKELIRTKRTVMELKNDFGL